MNTMNSEFFEALAMLEDLKGQIAQTGAKVNVGVVIFNKIGRAHV